MSLRLRNFTSANESAPESFAERLPKVPRPHLPALQQIKNRLRRFCYPNSISIRNAARRKIGEMQGQPA